MQTAIGIRFQNYRNDIHARRLIQVTDGVKLNRDFAPVTLLISVTNAISVHPSVPATSIADLVKLAKQQPSKLARG